MAFSFSNEQATGFENVLSDFETGGGRLCLLVELAYHISQHRWAEIMKTIEICVIDCGSHDAKVLFALRLGPVWKLMLPIGLNL